MQNKRRAYITVKHLLVAALISLLTFGATISTYAQSYFFKKDATIDVNDPTYENYDLFIDHCTVTINGSHVFSSLTVQNGGIITCSPNPSQTTRLNIIYDVIIFPGSSIDVSGKGFPSRMGTGAGGGFLGDNRTGGGGYGGAGGNGTSFGGGKCYGSITQPLDLGSGGGGSGGGNGGGAIQLTVEGTLVVNGYLTANGDTTSVSYGSGGSGGSIYVTANALAGNGVIRANGGNASYDDGSGGGGGGGGRIALYYTNSTFTGITQALGGGGYYRGTPGGAGTIFTKTPTQTYGDLLIANSSQGYSTDLSGVNVFDTIHIGSGGSLGHLSGVSGLHLVANTITIDVGSYVSVNGRGFGSNTGSGSGHGSNADTRTGGGGYGGAGGNGTSFGGGPTYGSITQPLDLGSGGGGNGGGAGGGAVQLTVGGTLTINGYIDANGGGPSVGYSSGGSGGSIYVSAGALTGNGVIRANGGNASYDDGGGGGGGGGGRIALYYTSSTFTGITQALGGGGYYRGTPGGAGTIFTKTPTQTYGDLLIANSGQGFSTDLSGTFTFDNIFIQSGGILSHPAYPNGGPAGDPTGNQSGLHITVTTSLTIDAGSYVSVGGRGFGPNKGAGFGYGNNAFLRSGGGGYGGAGGNGTSFGGGKCYGSITQPLDLGSGGGDNGGGAGGGAVQLTVGGTLTVNGYIDASGQGAQIGYSSGGSGGSIYVTANALAGNGVIRANGGNASYDDGSGGGGGGGGRIALYYTNSTFTGITQALGGGGYYRGTPGGAGTIFTKTPTQTYGDLLIANSSQGYSTDLSGVNVFDTIHIGSGGSLGHLSGVSGLHLVAGTLTIDAGGYVSVSGRGYSSRSGPGAGLGGTNDIRTGGGGYGGAGGNGTSFGGGPTYGSITQPLDLGSGGGGNGGGAGGGAVQLTVGGTLTVNGYIDANGQVAQVTYSSGGSGGSIYVSAGALTGNGVIRANGGNASYDDGGGGGGGGGGRIALYYTSSTFTGITQALGGGGYYRGTPGGAGTIFNGTPSIISGRVDLQGCVNSVQPITFQFRPVSGIPFAITQTLTSSGAFAFPVAPSMYSVAVKGSKWLQQVVLVDASGGSVSNVMASLAPGDANNDNIVDIGDFGIMVNAFGTVYDASNPGNGFDSNADFNCDAQVDIGDFGLLVNSFGSIGDK